jgi:hypothetical protein
MMCIVQVVKKLNLLNRWEVGCVSWNPTPLNASFIALVSGDRIGKMFRWFSAWGVSPGTPPLSTPPS